MNAFLNKAAAETFSRLLNWSRVFLPSFFLPNEIFGELIEIVTYEVLIGGIASYFGTKHILINQDNQNKEYLYSICFILVVFLTLFFNTFLDINFPSVFLSSLFFSFFQLEIYSIRVHNYHYSLFRILSSILSTSIFALIVYFEIFSDLYFLVPCSSLLIAFLIQQNHKFKAFSMKNFLVFISNNFKNFFNLTTVSISTNTWSYGLRIAITYFLSVEMLGIYSKPQLIASAITFLYAINMIIFEPTIYKEKFDNKIKYFFSNNVLKVMGLNFAISLVYTLIFFLIKNIGFDNTYIKNFNDTYINELFFIFMIAQIIHGLYLPIGSKLIALNGSNYSLISIIFSILSMSVFLFFEMKSINLISFATAYLVSETVLLICAYIFLTKIYEKK